MKKNTYKWTLDSDFEIDLIFCNLKVHRKIKHKVQYFYGSDGKTVFVSIYRGIIRIHAGYAWDGCSPKFRIGNHLVGTWDGFVNKRTGLQQMYYASLVHDALYQFVIDYPGFGLTREDADDIFLTLADRDGFPLAVPYYYAVRILGGIYHRRNSK